jgi:hypothetical protein
MAAEGDDTALTFEPRLGGRMLTSDGESAEGRHSTDLFFGAGFGSFLRGVAMFAPRSDHEKPPTILADPVTYTFTRSIDFEYKEDTWTSWVLEELHCYVEGTVVSWTGANRVNILVDALEPVNSHLPVDLRDELYLARRAGRPCSLRRFIPEALRKCAWSFKTEDALVLEFKNPDNSIEEFLIPPSHGSFSWANDANKLKALGAFTEVISLVDIDIAWALAMGWRALDVSHILGPVRVLVFV